MCRPWHPVTAKRTLYCSSVIGSKCSGSSSSSPDESASFLASFSLCSFFSFFSLCFFSFSFSSFSFFSAASFSFSFSFFSFLDLAASASESSDDRRRLALLATPSAPDLARFLRRSATPTELDQAVSLRSTHWSPRDAAKRTPTLAWRRRLCPSPCA